MATAVTVSGTLTDAEGTALTGTVTFRPSQPMADSAGQRVISTAPVTATLSSGAFSVVVYATDDATTTPTGATYDVSEDLTGADGSPIDRKYRVIIPAADTTLRYEDLVEVESRPYTAYTSTSTTAALTSTLNIVRSRPTIGGRCAAIGHSIVQGYDHDGILAPGTEPPDQVRRSKPALGSWFTWLCFLSGGRLAHVQNVGVGGQSSTQILARFANDVLTLPIDTVFVQACTNDPSPATGSALTAAESAANVAAMAALARAAGVAFVAVPEIAKDFEQDEIAAINAAVRLSAETNGFDVAPTDAIITDATNGDPITGYTFDGTHPYATGAKAIAEGVLSWVDQIGARTPSSSHLCAWDDDAANLVSKACFNSGAISGGAPPGWTNTVGVGNTGTATTTLVTPASGEDVQGNWLRFTFANLNGSKTESQTITGWSVGDVISIAVRCRWADITGDARWTFGLAFGGSGGSPRPISAWYGGDTGDVSDAEGIATLVYTVPADSTSCTVQIAVAGDGTNSGTVDFAQPTVTILEAA